MPLEEESELSYVDVSLSVPPLLGLSSDTVCLSRTLHGDLFCGTKADARDIVQAKQMMLLRARSIGTAIAKLATTSKQ